ncbi:MAG: prepilin peptidase [Candidatus Sericytochromatia bacterium]|nr:prepilin peptidase [Candidatus Sericytochromatia bacterium]
MQDWWVGAWLAFVFGAMVGSFLNVVVCRLPQGQSVVFPSSHCPNCHAAIRPWHNIPILGFLWLQGRCADCRAPISWRYPVTEALTGGLFLATYWHFAWSWQSLWLFLFVGLLVAIFWIDWDTMLIFDAMTLPGAFLGLAYSGLVLERFWLALAAALGAVALLLLLNSVTLWWMGVDGVGEGDMTLVAMLGAWLGVEGCVVALGTALCVASLMGLAVVYAGWGRERRWQPWGLALIASCAIYALTAYVTALPAGIAYGWLGAHLAPTIWCALLLASLFMGGATGWLYMRLTAQTPSLVMPFGPALVLGALVALFCGEPVWSSVRTWLWLS